MRSDLGYWFLDDAFVTDVGSGKLINGGFETGSLSPWIPTTPNATSNDRKGGFTTYYGNSLGGAPKTGTFFVNDGSARCFDQLGQKKNLTSS